MPDQLGCLVCGRRLPQGSSTVMGLFCDDCLPKDGQYALDMTGSVPAEVHMIRVPASRTDLGAFGTAENPRVVVFELSDAPSSGTRYGLKK